MITELFDVESAEALSPSAYNDLMAERSSALGLKHVDPDGDKVYVKKAFSLRAPPEIPEFAKLNALAKKRGFEFTEDHVERVVPYFASDERPDGHGDIVVQKGPRGIRFDRLKSNAGVLLDAHKSFAPPIGGILDWKIVDRVEKDYTGPALHLLTLFAMGEENPVADQRFLLVKSGLLKGGSIGFEPGEIVRVTDEEQRAKLGLGRFGVIHQKALVMEFSIVTIGANPGALQTPNVAKHLDTIAEAKALGLSAEDAELYRELFRRDCAEHGSPESRDAWQKADRDLARCCKTLFGTNTSSFKTLDDIDAPIVEADSADGTRVVIKSEDDSESLEERVDKALGTQSVINDAVLERLDEIQTTLESISRQKSDSSGDDDGEEGEEFEALLAAVEADEDDQDEELAALLAESAD